MATKPEPTIPGPDPNPRPARKQLPPGSCDAHAHLFGPAERYPYQPDRSYTPPDAARASYIALLKTFGFDRAVFVQPSVYGTDNRLMLDTLERARDTGCAISWRGIAVVDHTVSDETLETMDALGVRGVRINLLFRGGVDFTLAEELARRVASLGWHMQFLVDITETENFSRNISELAVPSVIDHMGHFPAVRGQGEPAFQDLLSVMEEGRTWVKLSGPNRIDDSPRPPFPRAAALAQALLEKHPEQLVFGTDWPHVQLPTPMPNDGDLVNALFDWTENDEALLARVLVHNPARLYGF